MIKTLDLVFIKNKKKILILSILLCLACTTVCTFYVASERQQQPIFWSLAKCKSPCLYGIKIGMTTEKQLEALINQHLGARFSNRPHLKVDGKRKTILFTEHTGLTRAVKIWIYDGKVDGVVIYNVNKHIISPLTMHDVFNEIGPPDYFKISSHPSPDFNTLLRTTYIYEELYIQIVYSSSQTKGCILHELKQTAIDHIIIMSNSEPNYGASWQLPDIKNSTSWNDRSKQPVALCIA